MILNSILKSILYYSFKGGHLWKGPFSFYPFFAQSEFDSICYYRTLTSIFIWKAKQHNNYYVVCTALAKNLGQFSKPGAGLKSAGPDHVGIRQ